MAEADGEHAGAVDPGGLFGGFGYWLSGVRAQGCGALDEFTKVEAAMAECGSHILLSGWPARGERHVVLEVDALGDVIGR